MYHPDFKPRSMTHSMTQYSLEVDTSVNEIVKFDLRLKCFKKRRATELTETSKQARLRGLSKQD